MGSSEHLVGRLCLRSLDISHSVRGTNMEKEGERG